MVLAFVIFLVILLLLQTVCLILIKNISLDMAILRSDMNMVRRTFVPPRMPDVGARPVPSLADIAAARARADLQSGPNQVNTLGVAQVGTAAPKT